MYATCMHTCKPLLNTNYFSSPSYFICLCVGKWLEFFQLSGDKMVMFNHAVIFLALGYDSLRHSTTCSFTDVYISIDVHHPRSNTSC
jgi:hypothetical protein